MAGLAVLTLVIAYLLLGIVAVSTARRKFSRQAAIAVLFIVVALPITDAIIGREVFRRLCEAEGQIVIHESVKNVEGIGVQYGVFKDSPAYYGYQYVEGGYVNSFKQSPWMYERAETSSTGEAVVVKNAVPKAQYLLHEGSLKQTFYFNQSHVSIREIQTDRELSGFTRFGFRGGWAEQAIFAFASSGPQNRSNCPDGHQNLREMTRTLLHSTLVPASNTTFEGTLRDKAAHRPSTSR